MASTLVMYLPGKTTAATIQVKTIHKPVPAGGTGKPHLGWNFPDACTAEWLACADLSTDSAWLFRIDEARKLAQQHSPNGQNRLYWFIDEPAPKHARLQSEMALYRIDAVTTGLLEADG